MAYYNEKRGEKDGAAPKEANGISRLYFEEKACRFGAEKFRVMVPRPAFADLIMNYPAAGAA